MARKKIWAYARNDNKEYIWNESLGREKLFYIWEALKIRQNDPKTFNSLTFMSTQSNIDKRAELTAVKNSKTAFFRYKSESVHTGQPQDPDAELLSHEIAILVLSEMKVIHFQQGETIHSIEIDRIKKDDLKIRFEDGATYYPDLMAFFSKPEGLAKKWGGKVAIEIKVTHPCSFQKIKDFKDHNIPIIEVSITDKLRLKAEMSNTNIDESTLEGYYKFLQSRFSNVVYMRVLSDPTMPEEYKQLIGSANETIAALKKTLSGQKAILDARIKEIEGYQHKLSVIENAAPRIKTLINEKTTENEAIKTQLVSHQQKITELEEQVTALELKRYDKLTFLERLRRLF